ncbi:MAG: hypothetical protein EXR58_08345 [Chloroflexi bacterium]|nr:hypothetical protein [Chloroflexota bacterium]
MMWPKELGPLVTDDVGRIDVFRHIGDRPVEDSAQSNDALIGRGQELARAIHDRALALGQPDGVQDKFAGRSRPGVRRRVGPIA